MLSLETVMGPHDHLRASLHAHVHEHSRTWYHTRQSSLRSHLPLPAIEAVLLWLVWLKYWVETDDNLLDRVGRQILQEVGRGRVVHHGGVSERRPQPVPDRVSVLQCPEIPAKKKQ